jgi:hypothetical protein
MRSRPPCSNRRRSRPTAAQPRPRPTSRPLRGASQRELVALSLLLLPDARAGDSP